MGGICVAVVFPDASCHPEERGIVARVLALALAQSGLTTILPRSVAGAPDHRQDDRGIQERLNVIPNAVRDGMFALVHHSG
jgi:hypothetical protein